MNSSPTSTEENGEPTVRNTPTPESKAEKILSFGEWWTGKTYAYTVLTLEANTSFDDVSQKNTEVEMPESEQLVFADLEIKNVSQESQKLIYDNFGAIGTETHYESIKEFDHPDYSESVDLDWLAKSDERTILRDVHTTLEPLESGEKRKYWVCFVTPRDLETSEIAIGYDKVTEPLYEIRWKK